jgi:hypothetical protein
MFRTLRRWDPLRMAAFGLGLAVVLMVAAYGFAAIQSRPAPGGIVAALAALAIAGCGLLYAWRLAAGGIVD